MRPRVLAVAILFSPALIGWAIPLPGRRDAAARFASARSAAASLSGGSMAAAPRPGPAGAFDKAVNLGAEKAAKPWKKIVPLALAAGIHVALGAWIAVSIGGSIPNLKAEHPGLQRLVYGAFGLPVGLLLTLIAGGEVRARARIPDRVRAAPASRARASESRERA